MTNEIYTDVEEALEDVSNLNRECLTESDSLSLDVLDIKVRQMMEDYLSLLIYYESEDL